MNILSRCSTRRRWRQRPAVQQPGQRLFRLVRQPGEAASQAIASLVLSWAGLRAGATLPPPALPVGPGARRPGQGPEADRDPGEDLVPEPPLQDQAEAAAAGADACCLRQESRRHPPREGREADVPSQQSARACACARPRLPSGRRRRRQRGGPGAWVPDAGGGGGGRGERSGQLLPPLVLPLFTARGAWLLLLHALVNLTKKDKTPPPLPLPPPPPSDRGGGLIVAETCQLFWCTKPVT